MDARRPCLVLLALVLPAVAHADRHKFGGRVAGADDRRSNLFGIGGSLDFPLALKPDTLTASTAKGQRHTFSAIVEGSVAWGEHEGEDISQFTYRSGLRYTLKPKDNGREFEIYIQALVGGWHSDSGERSDAPVVTVGAGLYCPLSIDSEKWGVSLQVDRYFPQGDPDAYTQISLGLVFRHHTRH